MVAFVSSIGAMAVGLVVVVEAATGLLLAYLGIRNLLADRAADDASCSVVPKG